MRLPDWIAVDEVDYAARAVTFAIRLDDLVGVRGVLRKQLIGSPLCDVPRFARGLEAVFRSMWRIFAGRGAPAPTV